MAEEEEEEEDFIEKLILKDFQQYLTDFNNENIQGVRSHLDDNLILLVNGALSGQGADNLLHLWQTDMNQHKRVEITKGPVCRLKKENGKPIAEIDVELTATTPSSSLSSKKGEPNNVQVVPVIYTYNVTTVKHIRHAVTVPFLVGGNNKNKPTDEDASEFLPLD